MSALKRLVVLGAGGTGQDVVDLIGAINAVRPTYECIGFLDDDPAKAGTRVSGHRVLGPLAQAAEFEDAWLVDSLGSPGSFRGRAALIDGLRLPEGRFETVIHPGAVVSPEATLGRGCIIYPFVMVGPEATLERHVIVLSHSVINHHAHIGEFSIVACGCQVSGRVRVGRSAYLGVGCCIREGIEVGDEVLAGAGSVVVENVPSGIVVAGVPARPLPRS